MSPRAGAGSPMTAPAPKYPPTPIYGECEADDCDSRARTTCTQCSGQHCLGHGPHAVHTAQSARSATN